MEGVVETVFIKGANGAPTRINASDYDEKKHGKQLKNVTLPDPIDNEVPTRITAKQYSVIQGADSRFYVTFEGVKADDGQFSPNGYASAPEAIESIGIVGGEFVPAAV